MSEPAILFKAGKIYRKFSPEWAEQGLFNVNKLPDLMATVITSRREMVAYIAALHDKIEWIFEHNNCCGVCFTADCISDHK